ncbi:hypothetical protein [Rickettsiella massiliensis]|uniref:hypothetical protein n=1 Tax=Rickettsiella massiliensis TaxID=676517 RepID=UPI00029A64C3|nr:hypothetical protein [Rickettsiella massiliensis]
MDRCDGGFGIFNDGFNGKKYIGFARQLLNTYLQATSDYQGLYILPYYLSYRAVVRAKIALLRLKQIDVNSEEKKRIQEDYHNFMRLATFYTQAVKPCLLIMHGLSGSGKTRWRENLSKKVV